MNNIKNYGFKPSYIEPDEYVQDLGATKLPKEVLVFDGDWTPWSKHEEVQRNELFDTHNCTGYATAKQIRMYMLRKFGIDFNPSERWIGIISGTYPPGNSPHKVMEAIRKHGLIPEGMLPFNDSIKTVDEYYSFKGSNKKTCEKYAKGWKGKYDFRHEWLFYPTATVEHKKKSIGGGLQSCPVSVSVVAWKKRNGKYYKEVGEQDTHWTLAEKEAWKIFDSYPEHEKELEAGYDFGFAKRIHISEREEKESFWDYILRFFGLK